MSYINPFRIFSQSKKAFTSNTSKNSKTFGFGNFETVQSLIASNNYNKCDISFPIFYHIPKVEDEMNYKRICHSINTLPMYQPFSIDELHFLYEMSESNEEFKKENFPAWNARIVIGKEKVYKKYEYISNDLVDKTDFAIYDSWRKIKDINDNTFKEMNEKIKKKANSPLNQIFNFTSIPNSNKSPFMTPSSNSINNIMNTQNPNNPFIMSNTQQNQISFNPPNTAPKPQMSFNPFTMNNTQIFNSNSQNIQPNPFLTPSKSTVQSINPYSGYFSDPKIADILTTQKKIEHSNYDKMLNDAYQTFSGKNEDLVDDENKKQKMKSLTNRLNTIHITDNKYFNTDNYSNSKLIYKKRKIGSTVMKKKPKPLLPVNHSSLNESQSQSNVEIVKYTLICKNDNKDICTIKSNSPYVKIKEIKEKIISSIAEQYKERQLEEKEIIIEINRNVINEDKINLEEMFPNQITNGFLSQNNIYNVFFTVIPEKKEEKIKKEDEKRKLLDDDYFPIMNIYKIVYPSEEAIMKMSKEELQHVKNLEIESDQCSIVFEDTIDITYVNFDLIKVDTNSLNITIQNNEHISKILTHAIVIFKNFIVDALTEEAYITQVTERCLSNLKTERYTYNRKDKELVCAVDLNNFIYS